MSVIAAIFVGGGIGSVLRHPDGSAQTPGIWTTTQHSAQKKDSR
jgi:hypothetical protein